MSFYSRQKGLFHAVFYGAVALWLTGCFSAQSLNTLDEIEGAVNESPVVETIIEYPGPSEEWAGPAKFALHVIAKDAGNAQVTVVPALFKTRGPASVKAKAISGELARKEMSLLAKSLVGTDVAYSGCMYPVRVRMLRADATLIERNGCRGQSGWTRNVSETVDYFLTTSFKAMVVESAAEGGS